jgi:hypothetical protein
VAAAAAQQGVSLADTVRNNADFIDGTLFAANLKNCILPVAQLLRVDPSPSY